MTLFGQHHHHHHHEHTRHGGPGGRFGGGPRGWGRGEGGGRRRVFDSNELKLVLLKLIEEQPRHGYDLIREIEARSGGAYAPSPGVIYPTLTLLGDMDLIVEQVAEGARKAFAITAAGRTHLAEHSDEVTALMARLAELAALREKTEGTSIRRAMMNLRSVLQNRLSEGDVDRDTVHAAAALIDEAAQKIERL